MYSWFLGDEKKNPKMGFFLLDITFVKFPDIVYRFVCHLKWNVRYTVHLFVAILYTEKVVSFYLNFDLQVHCIWFFIQLYSYSTLDGEVFGQRRDQAELLDGTIITLSQEQLRKVLCYTKYNNYWSKKISHCWHLRMANNQFEFNLDVCCLTFCRD